jgi:predicted dehydrogenase
MGGSVVLTMDAKNVARFAVIGTGSMAATMMSTFRRAGVPVIAVFSEDAERGRQFADAFGIPTSGNNLSSFLHDGEFDAVYIANASSQHATTTIAALEGGKAVLCEKPLAFSANEAERVVAAARRAGRLCMEGIWIRFLPAYRRFLELVRAHACGKPSHLFADFGYPVSKAALPRLLGSAAGGVCLDRGIYLVALALDVFGPIEKVDALLEFDAHGVDQHACLQLSHRGGGQSQLSTSFTALMSNTATLACSGGVIRLEEPLIGGETVSTRCAPVAHEPPLEAAQPLGVKEKLKRSLRERPLLRRLKRALPNARREYLSYGQDPRLPQLLHFLALLSAGAKESDIVPLELSLSIQRVIERALSD